MRVSQSFSRDVFLRNLRDVRSDLSEALARMSSGRRIRYASDDPAASAELVKLQDEAQALTVRRNGLSQARPWLQLTEQAVTELGNVLAEAETFAVQGSSSTLQPPQRLALAETISGLRRQVEGLTSLRISGRYLFSGTLTDTAPYAADGTYQGNDGRIEIRLDEGTQPINIPGDQIFGSSADGPLKILTDLEDALRNGTAQDVQNLLDPLRAAVQSNSTVVAQVGNLRKALEDADLRLADRQLSASERANDLGAANMAEAISDATRFQQNYDATLAAGARLYGSTFFDYLG